MNKQTFMNELKDALSGNVSSQVYYDTINYYEDYFRQKMAEGKSEEEIAASLGPGRIIAKTIIETSGSNMSGGEYYDVPPENEGRSSKSRRKAARNDEDYQKGWHIKIDEYGNSSLCYGKLDFSTTLGKVVIGLVLFAVLCIVVFVLYLGVKVLVYFVLPLVIILFIVNFIISIIDNHRM
jgi:hypothetical protein